MLQKALAAENAGNYPEAIAIYNSLCQQGITAAAFNLAFLYLRTGNTSLAIPLFQQIASRNPQDTDAIRGLAHCFHETGHVREAIQLFRASGSTSEALFYGLHTNNPEAPKKQERNQKPLNWDKKRPIKIGYVGVGIIGTVARFLNPILRNHTSQFEVKTYRTPTVDELSRDDNDIVVDLLGHMARGINILVLRDTPIPILASYIGYPAQTGLCELRITDTTLDPVATTDAIRLPGCCFAYDPKAQIPIVTGNKHVIFGSLNRSCKITKEVAQAWGEILVNTRNSELYCLAAGGEGNEGVKSLLVAHGVPSDRLKLIPQLERREYLDLMGSIDIHLDPFPYTGHTTTCDLLFQGVPTITLLGESYRARVGATLLTAAGYPDLVTTSVSAYIRKAEELAEEVERGRVGWQVRRDQMREQVRSSALMDGRRVTATLEAALCHLVECN